MSFRYHLHSGPDLRIMELGRAGRGSPGAYQWNNAAQGSMVFNSVSGRKQFSVGSTVLQHTKQDVFIDTLHIFFSKKKKRVPEGKMLLAMKKKKNPEKSRFHLCLPLVLAGSVSGRFAISVSFCLSAHTNALRMAS